MAIFAFLLFAVSTLFGRMRSSYETGEAATARQQLTQGVIQNLTYEVGLAGYRGTEACSAATGIEAETVRRLARELAAAPRAACYGRIGTCTQEFGTLASWLVDCVTILTGNLDREGGAMFPRPAHGPGASPARARAAGPSKGPRRRPGHPAAGRRRRWPRARPARGAAR